jgi:hypothetical protein
MELFCPTDFLKFAITGPKRMVKFVDKTGVKNDCKERFVWH